MNDYLNGYLSVIPQNQRKKILDLILANEDLRLSLTEGDYEGVINELTNVHQLFTSYTPSVGDVDKLSSSQFNKFNNTVYADLFSLFNESDLIEKAIISYEYLHTAELNVLQREVNALMNRIEELKLIGNNRSVIITSTDDFSRSSNMESDPAYSFMYKDRDGTELPLSEIQSGATSGILSLATVKSEDRIRNSNGKLFAKISIDDWRGQPLPQAQHTIKSAIDNSIASFWGETVLADDPINVGLKDEFVNIPGGGAMSKITILLPKAVPINEITLIPFTIYPIEIACILCERDPDNYEEPKFIINPDRPVSSENIIMLRFESIVARRLTIYIRQNNYVANTYAINDIENEYNELWDLISASEDNVELNLPRQISDYDPTVEQDKLDELIRWKIYIRWLEKHNKDIQAFINEYIGKNRETGKFELPTWTEKLPNMVRRGTK